MICIVEAITNARMARGIFTCPTLGLLQGYLKELLEEPTEEPRNSAFQGTDRFHALLRECLIAIQLHF